MSERIFLRRLKSLQKCKQGASLQGIGNITHRKLYGGEAWHKGHHTLPFRESEILHIGNYTGVRLGIKDTIHSPSGNRKYYT
jgi:hypothetical protein